MEKSSTLSEWTYKLLHKLLKGVECLQNLVSCCGRLLQLGVRSVTHNINMQQSLARQENLVSIIMISSRWKIIVWHRITLAAVVLFHNYAVSKLLTSIIIKRDRMLMARYNLNGKYTL